MKLNNHTITGEPRDLAQIFHRKVDWLAGCFGFNGPLRQYFSLYRAVSQRVGERGQKG